MSYAIFYDPCYRCEHKDTKKMCNMCELTYYRNQHVLKETAKELEEYVDKKFQNIKTKLEEQNEQGTSKA